MRRHSLDGHITHTHQFLIQTPLNSLSLHTMSSATKDLEDLLPRIDLERLLNPTSLMRQELNTPRTDKAVFRVSEFGLGNTDGRRVTFAPVSSLNMAAGSVRSFALESRQADGPDEYTSAPSTSRPSNIRPYTKTRNYSSISSARNFNSTSSRYLTELPTPYSNPTRHLSRGVRLRSRLIG
jgi:hypothetical protein